MKKVITLLLVLVFCGSAEAMNFPELGVCMNDGVRLRESPSTKSKVIGRADAGRQFIILGETKSGGLKWYKIDHPTKKGSAYILAKYAAGWYSEGKIPVGDVLANIRLTFGISPEKTKLLLGEPEETYVDGNFTSLKYSGCELQYESGNLNYIYIEKKGYAVEGIQVGDKESKLSKLGMPYADEPDYTPEEYDNWDFDEDGPITAEGWSYETRTGEQLLFEFNPERDGVTIDGILWNCPQGEG